MDRANPTNETRQDEATSRTADPSESSFGLRASDGPSAAQLAQERATAGPPGHTGESEAAVLDKHLHRRLPDLTDDELRRLTVLESGAALQQGSVYLDLNDLAAGPFTAQGGQTAGGDHRYIAKKETDYELWNRLTGRDVDGDGVPDNAPA